MAKSTDHPNSDRAEPQVSDRAKSERRQQDAAGPADVAVPEVSVRQPGAAGQIGRAELLPEDGAREPNNGRGREIRLAQATSDRPDQPADEATEDHLPAGVPGLPATGVSLAGSLPSLTGRTSSPLAPLNEETTRWGRDDLKRQEAGSQGEVLTSGVGSGLSHMVGLGDEEPGRRNGEKVISSDNGTFPGEGAGVGAGLNHLWLLGDFEYARASLDDPDEPIFRDYGNRGPSFGPLAPDAIFCQMVEDIVFTGRIFDPSKAVLPVTQRQIDADPVAGTVVFNQDGTFVFTPSNGFSGVTKVLFSFTDPRTGLVENGVITIVVEAVADPASISGAATTPEDVQIATPVTVSLNDPDGSEDIEQVVITGLPAGATLTWDLLLPGSVVAQPDGSFLVTGSTQDIQDLLGSLAVMPPADFDGRITLGIDVTIIEDNVDPDLPGYQDRETTHFDYHIDVVAVADAVTATGAAKTTDEDVAVHLDTLAATYGDLVDGSETHGVEIRGVDAAAKLQDALGQEYTFTIAGDGTKTYTLPPADLGDVYFLPPPDESGLFSGMTIVAIATESTNGDQQTASAPITVLVDPVADPLDIVAPNLATDEDTLINFGASISIIVNDPLTQTVTDVVVSGFPPGTTVTYVPVGGGAPITVVTGVGSSISLTGGTEQEIRDALATLSLTPPLHTDQNITLSIAATTEDLGGVTDTQTASMAIAVAAVADGPAISGTASGNEDQPIALPITVARIDADGSEQYEFAEITIPAGVTLSYPLVLPNGITVAVSGNIYTLLQCLHFRDIYVTR